MIPSSEHDALGFVVNAIGHAGDVAKADDKNSLVVRLLASGYYKIVWLFTAASTLILAVVLPQSDARHILKWYLEVRAVPARGVTPESALLRCCPRFAVFCASRGAPTGQGNAAGLLGVADGSDAVHAKPWRGEGRAGQSCVLRWPPECLGRVIFRPGKE